MGPIQETMVKYRGHVNISINGENPSLSSVTTEYGVPLPVHAVDIEYAVGEHPKARVYISFDVFQYSGLAEVFVEEGIQPIDS